MLIEKENGEVVTNQRIVHNKIRIVPDGVWIDNELVYEGFGDLNTLYRTVSGDYPKFFKMDGLSKLGFLAAEILLKDKCAEMLGNSAVVLFSRSGSLCTDRKYQTTISDNDYFPSPAVFVYTLANIVTGEIAIRHKIFGETCSYILEKKDEDLMGEIAASIFATSTPSMLLYGWVDYESENDYEADVKLVYPDDLKMCQ